MEAALLYLCHLLIGGLGMLLALLLLLAWVRQRATPPTKAKRKRSEA